MTRNVAESGTTWPCQYHSSTCLVQLLCITVWTCPLMNNCNIILGVQLSMPIVSWHQLLVYTEGGVVYCIVLYCVVTAQRSACSCHSESTIHPKWEFIGMLLPNQVRVSVLNYNGLVTRRIPKCMHVECTGVCTGLVKSPAAPHLDLYFDFVHYQVLSVQPNHLH